MHIFCGLRAWYNILSVIYCIGKKGKRKEKLKKMLEKVRILLTEENREAAKQAERLAGRLRAEGLEAEEIRISGEKAEGSGTPGDRPGEILPAEQAEGELWITDCPEAARRLAGENCRILLYLTEKSSALPLGEYPYAVESLEGIGAEELEGIWRRLTGEPWEILHTERLIVREQREEDLDSLYEIYAHPDMTAYMEGLSADRQEERERLTSYIRTVYPLYGFGLWMLEKREPEKGEKAAGRIRAEGWRRTVSRSRAEKWRRAVSRNREENASAGPAFSGGRKPPCRSWDLPSGKRSRKRATVWRPAAPF